MWIKSEDKGEKSELRKTKKVVKRQRELKKGKLLNNSRWKADGGC